jgi:hypothetical protein
VRPFKQHLKFPLFLDEKIGMVMSNPIVRDSKLIDASADEDYETDQNILRRTI